MAFTRPSFPPRHRLARAGTLAFALLSVAWLATRTHAQPVEGLPYITRVEIVGEQPCDTCPPQVCPLRPIVVRIEGELPDGCVHYRGIKMVIPVGYPIPGVIADILVDTCAVGCPDVLTTFSDSVSFPAPPPGRYRLWVESHVRSCPDTSVVARFGARPFTFDVLGTCSDPPPADSLLRSFLAFGTRPDPACNGDSVSIVMTMNGCPPCLNFESFVADSTVGLVATMNWQPDCVEFACMPETLSANLGQFAAGSYGVNVNVIAHVLGTPVADSTIAFQTLFQFEVQQTCDTTRDCVQPFLYARLPDPGACAVQVPPGGEGSLTLVATSGVPLGGLQGALDVQAPFRITGLFAPAAFPHLQVSWVQEGRGARYVVFATNGGTIPAGIMPVMTVRLAADSGSTPGTNETMGAWVMLASDPGGHEVPLCDISRVRIGGVPLCVAGQSLACDANDDLVSDVRDLVIMSKCSLVLPIPGAGGPCQDCDGDGDWAFSDLLCCAQHILRLPMQPRDSVSVSGLAVTIEEVARDVNGRLVRVRVTGAEVLGAAMLRLRYPGERWRAGPAIVFGTDRAAAASEGWLPIMDPDLPGVVQLGGLRLTTNASSEIEFLLAMRSIAAAHEDDALVVEGVDLAASDGVAFTVASLPRLSLGTSEPPPPPVSRLELGRARPNPFTDATSFTLSLPTAAHVELSVHDLFGRRVATLLSQELPAGQREATWNAASARDGMYFVRLVVNGKVLTQRVALLRDRR